jgi:hypothetical protein
MSSEGCEDRPVAGLSPWLVNGNFFLGVFTLSFFCAYLCFQTSSYKVTSRNRLTATFTNLSSHLLPYLCKDTVSK